MNRQMATVIVAPMTTRGRLNPTRVECHFDARDGQIVLDQIRTVDKRRLVRHLGKLDETTQRAVLSILAQMFAE